MPYARVFKLGNSQAVQLPKEFCFNVEQVEIFRRGNEVVLREHSANATAIFDALTALPQDLLKQGRQDAPPQKGRRALLVGNYKNGSSEYQV